MPLSIVVKVVLGGQSGADRAALDFAVERGIPHGGCCPKVRVGDAKQMKRAALDDPDLEPLWKHIGEV